MVASTEHIEGSTMIVRVALRQPHDVASSSSATYTDGAGQQGPTPISQPFMHAKTMATRSNDNIVELGRRRVRGDGRSTQVRVGQLNAATYGKEVVVGSGMSTNDGR